MKRGIGVIEVRPEGYTDGSGLDITLNRRDMRSKFELSIQRCVPLVLKEVFNER